MALTWRMLLAASLLLNTAAQAKGESSSAQICSDVLSIGQGCDSSHDRVSCVCSRHTSFDASAATCYSYIRTAAPSATPVIADIQSYCAHNGGGGGVSATTQGPATITLGPEGDCNYVMDVLEICYTD